MHSRCNRARATVDAVDTYNLDGQPAPQQTAVPSERSPQASEGARRRGLSRPKSPCRARQLLHPPQRPGETHSCRTSRQERSALPAALLPRPQSHRARLARPSRQRHAQPPLQIHATVALKRSSVPVQLSLVTRQSQAPPWCTGRRARNSGALSPSTAVLASRLGASNRSRVAPSAAMPPRLPDVHCHTAGLRAHQDPVPNAACEFARRGREPRSTPVPLRAHPFH